jgi:hypothetical protein
METFGQRRARGGDTGANGDSKITVNIGVIGGVPNTLEVILTYP